MDSLEMLKSKEGQLNAVFACYGSAAQHGQLFEDALSQLVLTLNRISGNDLSTVDLLAVESRLRKKTMGQLIGELKKRVTISHEWVYESLRIALEKRNFLIHEYFLKRQDEFEAYSGRMGMLSELLSIENAIKRATDITNGMRVAVNQALDGSHEESEDATALFSIEVHVDDRQ